MKVSGAVAMADDPGHAFGVYLEKIEPTKTDIKPGDTVYIPDVGTLHVVAFDAQEDKPQFNPGFAQVDHAIRTLRCALSVTDRKNQRALDEIAKAIRAP